MKVVVNKCRYTGKLFEDKKKYAAHLKKLQYERAKTRAEQRVKDGLNEWLAEEKEKLVNPDMIGPWVLENQQKLMLACNALHLGTWSHDVFYIETDRFTKFDISVKWQGSVSNSHSCPRNGVTNCGGHVEGAPRGYPGWYGSISGALARSKKDMSSYPYSNICKLLDLHTGTGGGGNNSWSYDVSIFTDDWPVLAESVTFARLVNGPV